MVTQRGVSPKGRVRTDQKKPASKKVAPKKVAKKPAPVAQVEKIQSLVLATITVDPALQPRVEGLNQTVIEEYTEFVKGGGEFDKLMVVYEDEKGDHWLSEGFHRHAAYTAAGMVKAKCLVRKGSRRDALVNAAGSNAVHGLRRTNADKRRAVNMVLAEYPVWSNRKIAAVVGVSDEFVRNYRDEQVPTVGTSERIGLDGKTYSAPSQGVNATKLPSSAPLDSAPARSPTEPEEADEPDSADEGAKDLPSAPPRTAPVLSSSPPRPTLPIQAVPFTQNADGSISGIGASDVPDFPVPTSLADKPIPDGTPCDQLGRPLIGDHLEKLIPVFEQREAVKIVNQSAGSLIAELKELDKDEALGGFLKRQRRFVYGTEQIAEYLRLRLAPFCVCPCCDARGKKCPTCGAKGWIARAGFEQLHPAAAEKARSFSAPGATGPDDSIADRAEWNSAEWAASGRDSVGNTIPPRLRDDFACDDLLEDVRELERIAFQMSEAKGYLFWLKPEAHEVLAQAVRYVRDSIPYAVCVNCEGKGCAKCLTSGYHPKWSHDAGHNNTDGQAVATKAGGK